jgi:hypothetical protein
MRWYVKTEVQTKETERHWIDNAKRLLTMISGTKRSSSNPGLTERSDKQIAMDTHRLKGISIRDNIQRQLQKQQVAHITGKGWMKVRNDANVNAVIGVLCIFRITCVAPLVNNAMVVERQDILLRFVVPNNNERRL